MRNFAEALFQGYDHMAISIDQVVTNFESQFAMIGGTAAERMGKNLSTLATVMNLLFGFDRASPAKRKAIVDEQLRHGRLDVAQDAARLKAVIYGAYYGHWEVGDEDANRHNEVLKQIGFILPKHRDRDKPGELKIDPVEGRDLEPGHILGPNQVPAAVDVIVIGSGSGGAVAAWNLAKHHSVLVIEAGPFVDKITHEERRMGARLYKHGTLQTTDDNDIVIFQGRNAGGSPTVNNGICLRMHDDPLTNDTARNPFDGWKARGADIGYETLHDHDDAIRDELKLHKAEPRSGRGNGNHLYDGWGKFAAGKTDAWITGAKRGWFIKNYGSSDPDTACAYCGYCNTGCPYSRKIGMAQSFLPKACRERGARILPDTKVEQIVWAPRVNGAKRRAIGVIAVVGDKRVERVIRARVGVVVAAGTIASSKLLDRSGIKGTGKGISLNVASPVVALMPADGWPAWDEDQMTTAVDCGDFWLESHFQPPQSMAMLLGGWFGDMDKRMQSYGRMRSAGVLIPIDRRGKLSGETLKLEFGKEDLALLRRALGVLTRVHFANGAREVWPSIRTGKAVLPTDDVDAFYRDAIREQDDVTLSSAHPHGGNAISSDPKKGVVDLECRIHGVENVLVADASVFPSCIGVNAQFTVMAVANHATAANPFAGVAPM